MPSLQLNSAALLTAVKQASTLLLPNPLIPIYNNFLLIAEQSQLLLVAGNGEAELTLVVAGVDVDDLDAFRICLSGKLLTNILSNLPAQPITLRIDMESFTGTVLAASGRYKIPGENARDWPAPLPETQTTLLVGGKALAQAIAVTAGFASTDRATRPDIACICLQALGARGLRVVGINNHSFSWSGFAPELETSALGHYLMPTPVAKQLQLLGLRTERLKLEVGSWLVATSELTHGTQPDWTLKARLVDTKYPAYENVIPLERNMVATVSRADLQQAVRRLAAFSDEESQSVTLRFGLDWSTLQLVAESFDHGSDADEKIAVDFQGEPMDITFSCRKLTDCLAAIDAEQLRIVLLSPNKVVVFEAVDAAPDFDLTTRTLCMPIVRTTPYMATK